MTESSPRPGSVIGGGTNKPRKKLWIICLIAVMLLAVIGVSAWKLLFRPASENISTNQVSAPAKVVVKEACSDALVKEAATPLIGQDIATLGEVVEKIRGVEDYDRDADCVYIVLSYSIAQGDVAASKDSLATFEKIYNPAIGLDDVFAGHELSIVSLREMVAFLVENEQNINAASKQHDETVSVGSQKADEIYRERQQ